MVSPDCEVSVGLLLHALRVALEPEVSAAAFELIEENLDPELAWLAYRRNGAGTPILDIFHRSSDGTVTAELWSPRRLAAALRAGRRPDAIRTWTWRLAPGTDPAVFATELVAVVRPWLQDGSGARGN